MKKFILFIIIIIFIISANCYATIYYTPGDKNIYSIEDVANTFNSLPQTVKNVRPDIYIVQSDPYGYSMGSLDKRIWIYTNQNIKWWIKDAQIRHLRRTLIHECGHVLSYRRNVNWTQWQILMNKDGNFVRIGEHYMRPWEDFAESFVLYIDDIKQLEKRHPARYKAIKNIIIINDEIEMYEIKKSIALWRLKNKKVD